jgi:antitoxin ParD1/3/4
MIDIMSKSEHFTNFINAQVRSGRYGSNSDVVRAGLRLLEAHDLRAKALQNALIAGEESGIPVPFDSEEFLARMHANQVQ